MNTQAALLSALVFPGAGQLLLKRTGLATILIVISVVCLYFLLANVMDIANDISDKIVRGQVALDIMQINHAISSALAQNCNRSSISVASWGLGICWVVGILDTFRKSKTQIN